MPNQVLKTAMVILRVGFQIGKFLHKPKVGLLWDSSAHRSNSWLARRRSNLPETIKNCNSIAQSSSSQILLVKSNQALQSTSQMNLCPSKRIIIWWWIQPRSPQPKTSLAQQNFCNHNSKSIPLRRNKKQVKWAYSLARQTILSSKTKSDKEIEVRCASDCSSMKSQWSMKREIRH